MPTTRPLKVFLCHASADKPAVRKLYHYLRERKMDPWLDAEKLLPGQNWKAEIPKALLSSDVIIICLSKNSVDKEGYVQKEIRFALDKALEMPEGRIFLIPARLEECNLPESLSAYHYVNLFEADGYRRLLRSLRVRAEQIGAAKVSVGKDTVPPNVGVLSSREAQSEISAPSMPQRQASEPQNETAIDVGGDVSGANNIVGNNNVIQIIPKPEAVETKPEAVNASDEKIVRISAPITEPRKIRPEAKLEPASQNDILARLPREAEPKPSASFKILGIGLLALVILSLGSWGLIQLGSRMFSPTRTETPVTTKAPTQTPTVPSTMTSTPMLTKTPISEPTLGIGSTMIGSDGMTLLYVPAGNFLMGSSDADSLANNDEKPQHTVYLDAFWIDQTEVTNKQYAACVSANQCKRPFNTDSHTPDSSYYGKPKFDDYPVIYISWDNANAYCSWVGRRLPTEAEWEKAARGMDGRVYPWGNTAPNKDLLNYASSVGDTTKVGSYETGKTLYGAYDMAGNVWEWVNDWYSDSYYRNSPSANPLGPDSGTSRVLRGGYWGYGTYGIRSAVRGWDLPTNSSYALGFRCARSVTP